MKRILILSICVFLLVFSLNSVSEAGFNKLVTIPTADIMSSSGAIGAQLYPNYKQFEVGYRFDSKIELGGLLNLYNNHSQKNYQLGPVIKVSLSSETINQPAITGGLTDRDIYLVMSKSLNYGFRGHLGIGNGRFENLFIGVNKVISPPVKVEISEGETSANELIIPPVNLMAEYVNQKINLGARMSLPNNIYVDLGLLNLENFTAGISYTF